MRKDFPLNGMILNCSPQKNSYSYLMSVEVLHNKKLSSTAKLIYCEITNHKDYFSETNSYLANIFGLSKITISTKISELIKAGYLKSETVQVRPFPEADWTIAERRLIW